MFVHDTTLADGSFSFVFVQLPHEGGFTHGGRTFGVLAVARSFGDHAFKK